MSKLEELTKRFNTVAAFYHDAYVEWQVSVDPRRCVEQDCGFVGWGETLDAAVDDVLRNVQEGKRR